MPLSSRAANWRNPDAIFTPPLMNTYSQSSTLSPDRSSDSYQVFREILASRDIKAALATAGQSAEANGAWELWLTRVTEAFDSLGIISKRFDKLSEKVDFVKKSSDCEFSQALLRERFSAPALPTSDTIRVMRQVLVQGFEKISTSYARQFLDQLNNVSYLLLRQVPPACIDDQMNVQRELIIAKIKKVDELIEHKSEGVSQAATSPLIDELCFARDALVSCRNKQSHRESLQRYASKRIEEFDRVYDELKDRKNTEIRDLRNSVGAEAWEQALFAIDLYEQAQRSTEDNLVTAQHVVLPRNSQEHGNATFVQRLLPEPQSINQEQLTEIYQRIGISPEIIHGIIKTFCTAANNFSMTKISLQRHLGVTASELNNLFSEWPLSDLQWLTGEVLNRGISSECVGRALRSGSYLANKKQELSSWLDMLQEYTQSLSPIERMINNFNPGKNPECFIDVEAIAERRNALAPFKKRGLSSVYFYRLAACNRIEQLITEERVFKGSEAAVAVFLVYGTGAASGAINFNEILASDSYSATIGGSIKSKIDPLRPWCPSAAFTNAIFWLQRKRLYSIRPCGEDFLISLSRKSQEVKCWAAVINILDKLPRGEDELVAALTAESNYQRKTVTSKAARQPHRVDQGKLTKSIEKISRDLKGALTILESISVESTDRKTLHQFSSQLGVLRKGIKNLLPLLGEELIVNNLQEVVEYLEETSRSERDILAQYRPVLARLGELLNAYQRGAV